MDREQWLEWRRRGIGASDAIILMNEAPRHWKINTPFKLWQNRLGMLENEMNAAMQRGNQYEEEALSWFQKEVKACLFSQQCYEHAEKNWMRATFDGIDVNEEISVELKVSSKENFEQVKGGKIPQTYLPQVLHQMEVKPTKHHFFCVYLPEYREGAYVEVEPNPMYLKEMMGVEEKFWACLKNSVPPELTEKDFEDRTSDENWLSQAMVLAQYQEQLRELKKLEDEAKKRLVEMSAGQSCVGGSYKLTKCVAKGRVDYGAIPFLDGVDLDPYRKPGTESFRFSF